MVVGCIAYMAQLPYQNTVHSYMFDGFGWMVGVGVVMARVLAVWVSTAPPAQIDLV